MPTDLWGGIIWSVAPTIVVGLIFWFIIRMIVRADRDERKAYSRIEAEERAKVAAESRQTTGS
jgi:flagellar biosynthesis/type III secretory pathway M-ring protein FliF/YscJ